MNPSTSKTFWPIVGLVSVLLFQVGGLAQGSNCKDGRDLESQIRLYTKMIKADPGYAMAYAWRGAAYNWADRHSDALRDFDRAIELNPHLAQAYIYRGYFYHRFGKLRAAVQEFTKAIEADPNSFEAYYARARSNFDHGPDAGRIDDLNNVLTLRSDLPQPYYARGIELKRAGANAGAMRDFETAVAIATRSIEQSTDSRCVTDDYLLRAIVYVAMQKDDLAFADFASILMLDPKDFEAFYYRASLFHRLRRYQWAIDDYTSALKLDRYYALSYLGRSQIYDKIGERAKAESDRKRHKELSEGPIGSVRIDSR